MNTQKKKELDLIAAKMRKQALLMIQAAGAGHVGGSFSVIEILTVLYFDKLNIDVNNPEWEDRDRFVLSKGHCTPAMYSALAMRGFFPVEHLKTFRKIDSNLSGHVEMKYVPGVDMSTGSLGQGVSSAFGMALSAKLYKKNFHVFAVVGDGEIQEGQVWEMAMAAGNRNLDNFTVFIDNNRLQLDGTIEQIMDPEPIDLKFKAFKWDVYSIDGHDVAQITEAVDKAKMKTGKPTAIIAQTIKGKGVSFMENDVQWHGKTPSPDQYLKAFAELDAAITRLEE